MRNLTRLELLLGAISVALFATLTFLIGQLGDARALGIVVIALTTVLATVVLIQIAVSKMTSERARWWQEPVSRERGHSVFEGVLKLWMAFVVIMTMLLVAGAFLRTELGFLVVAVFAVAAWLASATNRRSPVKSLGPYAVWMTVAVAISYCILKLFIAR
jgi:hypothetical protein